MILARSKLVREIVGVLETGNFLLVKLLLQDAAKARSFPGLVFRDYMKLAGRGRWLSKSMEELFPDFRGDRIVVEHVTSEGIATPLDELAYLALVTKIVRPAAIFEIGTFRGRTALNFALNSPPDCTVFTLDLPPEGGHAEATDEAHAADRALIHASAPGADYRGKDVEHKIEQLYGNSLSFDFSPYFGRMDIVFVDGAHHYEAAKSDSENALRMLRPGGLAIWHDFANYGDYNDVTRAVLASVPAPEVVQIEDTQLALYRKPDGPTRA